MVDMSQILFAAVFFGGGTYIYPQLNFILLIKLKNRGEKMNHIKKCLHCCNQLIFIEGLYDDAVNMPCKSCINECFDTEKHRCRGL